MRADTSDVAFRLLLSLSDLWEGIQRSGIDPSARGLHLTNDYLGGYKRVSAGCGSHPRLIVEWNESSRHLRVIRCDEWPGFDAVVSNTVGYVRQKARTCGLIDVVDSAFVHACEEPKPARRTVVTPLWSAGQAHQVARRA